MTETTKPPEIPETEVSSKERITIDENVPLPREKIQELINKDHSLAGSDAIRVSYAGTLEYGQLTIRGSKESDTEKNLNPYTRQYNVTGPTGVKEEYLVVEADKSR